LQNTIQPNSWQFLSYVTIRQAFSVLKTEVSAWLILSIFLLAGGSLGIIGSDALAQKSPIDFPNWVWFCALWCLISWQNRGTELKIPFPKLTFVQWAFYCIFVFALAFAFNILPWWASCPIWVGIICFISGFERLASIGKDNYESLTRQSE
jgi:hypothetical protein